MAEGTQAMPGDVIAQRYQVVSWLGQGNMAIVYQAKHVHTGKACALKLVHSHLVTRKEFVDLFVKEARLGARIGENPHIVDVFDAGVDEVRKVPYLAMELLQGETLEGYMKTHGRMPPRMLATLFTHLADALDQAHGAGVIHRDLKPGNLFIGRDRKGNPMLKVMDFGIAKVLEGHEQKNAATQIGSPAYAAPEQLGATLRSLAASQGISISQSVQASTDVWALGLVAYEALTGATPGSYWGVDSYADLMICIALEEHQAASARAGELARFLPPGFDAWFGRCIQRDANARWQSAGDAVRELVRIIDAFLGEPAENEAKPSSKGPHSMKGPLPKPKPVPIGAKPVGPLRPSVTGLPVKPKLETKLPAKLSEALKAAPKAALKPAAARGSSPELGKGNRASSPDLGKGNRASSPDLGKPSAAPTPAPATARSSSPDLGKPPSAKAPPPPPPPAAARASSPDLGKAAMPPPLPTPSPAPAAPVEEMILEPDAPARPGPPPKPPALPNKKPAPPPMPARREPPAPPLPKPPPITPKERARLQEQAAEFEKNGQWAELCEVLRKLEAVEPSMERKARLLNQIGVLQLERLDQPERAIEAFEEALDRNPSMLDAFDRIVAIYQDRNDWKKIERAHRKMLHRHASIDDAALKHRLWHTLAEIYRDVFEDADAAIEAFQASIRYAPNQPDDHLALAALCDYVGRREEAIEAYQASLRFDPAHIEVYREIYRIAVELGAYDVAWCAAGALSFLHEADEEQQTYYIDYRPDGRLQVRSRLDAELWTKHVYHPDQSLLIGKIFEMVARAAMKAKMEALRQKKELPALDPFLRQDPTTSGVPFVRTMGWASRVLGVSCPALFVRSDVPGAVVAVPSEPPSSVVGQTLLTGFSSEELAYIAGKHLAMYRGEHYIKLLFPSEDELRVIFHAALRMAIPEASAPRDIEIQAAATAKVLRSFMGPREQDGLRAAARRFVSEREEADIGKYFRAVEYTATRAGFLLAGDLVVAKKIIAAEPSLPDDPAPADKMKDLLAYSVSSSYVAIREVLGIAIGQEG